MKFKGTYFESGLREVRGGERFTNLIIVALILVKPTISHNFLSGILLDRYAHRPVNPDDPPALKQSRPDHPYRTVGCVFNHRTFYANSQVRNQITAWE